MKKINDKNILKLFKLGQLTTEYLLYTHVSFHKVKTYQKYMEGLASGMEREYTSNYNTSMQLEEAVKVNQLTINKLRADGKTRKATLKTYENLLSNPTSKDQNTA